jgi:hypothetical protein
MVEFESEPNESGKSNKDENELNKATSAFTTLLVNINNINKTSETHFISIVSLLVQTTPIILVEIANTLVNDFNSISLVYQLISRDFTLTLVKSCIKDAYTFIIKGTFKYDSYHFYKVVIDINALKYSIIRLKQF